MSELYDLCREQFQSLNASIKEKLQDRRLSLREVTTLCREFARGAVVIAKPLQVPGADKKALVIEAALELWDYDLESINLPGPDGLTDPMIRAVIPYAVGAAVDCVVWAYNRLGWPTLAEAIGEETESGTEVA